MKHFTSVSHGTIINNFFILPNIGTNTFTINFNSFLCFESSFLVKNKNNNKLTNLQTIASFHSTQTSIDIELSYPISEDELYYFIDNDHQEQTINNIINPFLDNSNPRKQNTINLSLIVYILAINFPNQNITLDVYCCLNYKHPIPYCISNTNIKHPLNPYTNIFATLNTNNISFNIHNLLPENTTVEYLINLNYYLFINKHQQQDIIPILNYIINKNYKFDIQQILYIVFTIQQPSTKEYHNTIFQQIEDPGMETTTFDIVANENNYSIEYNEIKNNNEFNSFISENIEDIVKIAIILDKPIEYYIKHNTKPNITQKISTFRNINSYKSLEQDSIQIFQNIKNINLLTILTNIKSKLQNENENTSIIQTYIDSFNDICAYEVIIISENLLCTLIKYTNNDTKPYMLKLALNNLINNTTHLAFINQHYN